MTRVFYFFPIWVGLPSAVIAILICLFVPVSLLTLSVAGVLALVVLCTGPTSEWDGGREPSDKDIGWPDDL